jgi:hypothetical protein
MVIMSNFGNGAGFTHTKIITKKNDYFDPGAPLKYQIPHEDWTEPEKEAFITGLIRYSKAISEDESST